MSTSDTGATPTLTMHQLREIAARTGAGESPTKLAAEFGVTLEALTAQLPRLPR